MLAKRSPASLLDVQEHHHVPGAHVELEAAALPLPDVPVVNKVDRRRGRVGHVGFAEFVLQVCDRCDRSGGDDQLPADVILLRVGEVGEEHKAQKGDEGSRDDDLAEFSRLTEGKGVAKEASASVERRTLNLYLY